MNSQKNQDNAPKTLLEGIQGEVSAENAPLLDFITKYAGLIAGFVLLLLLILGGAGVWKWYHGGKQKEAQEEMARINMELKGAEHDQALKKLAENAPENTRIFMYLTLGQSAQANGNPVLAGEAYAQAAKLGGDSALGMISALGSAGSLLMQSKYAEALALLEEFRQKIPMAAQSAQFQEMLAEAAARAGSLALARKTYENLSAEVHTPEAAYFRSRAEAIGREIAAQEGK